MFFDIKSSSEFDTSPPELNSKKQPETESSDDISSKSDESTDSISPTRPWVTSIIFGGIIWFGLLAGFQSTPVSSEIKHVPFIGAFLSSYYISTKDNRLIAQGTGLYISGIILGIFTPFFYYLRSYPFYPNGLLLGTGFGFLFLTLPALFIGRRRKKKARERYGYSKPSEFNYLSEEEIIGKFQANWVQEGEAIGGELYLTNKRLLFRATRFYSNKIETWRLSEITAVGKEPKLSGGLRDTLFAGGLRDRLKIGLEDGGNELFVANSLYSISKRINEQKRKLN